MNRIWGDKALKKKEIEELKQKLRNIGEPLPVKAISEYTGLKPHFFVDWLNGYIGLPDSKLQQINEYLLKNLLTGEKTDGE